MTYCAQKQFMMFSKLIADYEIGGKWFSLTFWYGWKWWKDWEYMSIRLTLLIFKY